MSTQPGQPKPHGALLEMCRKDLRAWRRMYEQRDERVQLAYRSGLGVNEITRITGLAKTTVLRILEAER